ncbi:M56 family metallopeptidase (plasmid) [Rhodococcus pyridinivorans]|uniref:M56 family metallopeptidase n=1 Tax=Rhodococcus pyridinivorans TaxID=103816 RepID=UPI001FFEC236|nr:M56 family metallopeptidase [Rhodococcus pyridinivorans]UPK66474.1 M56 family metallopeptidase [Rhodococcus pyridinivorans]
MILATILLLGAVLIAVAAPAALRRLTSTALPPGLLLAAWLGSMVGTLFFAGSAVVVLAWPDHAPAEAAAETLVRCLSTISHAVQPWITEILAGAGVLALATLAGRTLVLGRRHVQAQARLRTYHLQVISIVARSREDGVMWLDHPMPLAYSVAGRPGFVVATEGLSSCLSRGEREAVLAHERAHLNGGHHHIVSGCEILAAVFPAVPLFSAAPGAVRTLVELAADQHAVRATSAATVGAALTAVSSSILPQPAGTLGLSNETALRLRKLGATASVRCPKLSCATAAALSWTLPAVAAWGAVAAVSVLTCLALR